MENIRKATGNRNRSISEKISDIEDELAYGKLKRKTLEEQEELKFPWRWKSQMRKSNRKRARDRVLIFYLNIKGEIEPPILVPLFSGNIIIYRNKAYEFDPRASWLIKLPRGKMVKAVIIKEIDRRPVSNLDWDEIKARGDATDSDEILVKMVTKAVIEKAKKQIAAKGIIVFIIIAIIIAGIVYFFFRG